MNKEIKKWQENLQGKLLRKFEKMSTEEKEKNFAGTLAFGTAGVRGIMALGSGCINEITITKIIGGFCKCLDENSNKKVLIAFDTRKNSKKYAYLCQKILNKFNINSTLFKKATPTSVLSYSVKKHSYDYGIMITSSHNPKEYNGIKVLANNGGQISDKIAKKILSQMKKIDEFKLFYSLKKIKHNFAPKSYKQDFLEMCYGVKYNNLEPNISICYTPLNGTALSYAKSILKHFGYYFVIPTKQKRGNGKFKTCPYPNPEFVEAFDESRKWDEERSDIFVANDPDGDRIGVMVKHKGELKHLTGNQVGLLFLDYLSNVKTQKDSFAVSTVVSSPLVEKLCKKKKIEHHSVLTGFKNIGEKIESQKDKSLLVGFEESYGYIVDEYLRDKDGLTALALICEIANYYSHKNMTLIDALEEIYLVTGYEKNISESIKFTGTNAFEDMNNIVEKLRSKKKFEDVTKVVDFMETDKTKLPASNFLGFNFKYGKLFIRPSGTEPKLKLYIYGLGANQNEANLNAEKIHKYSKELINSVK